MSGGAGTGKTLVAIERARRLAAEGRRVLLLCYNRGLAAYLKPRADGFTVSTFHSLCDTSSRSAGLAWPTKQNGPGAQALWREEAPALLLQALDRLPDERFDAVIVDEGQDFHEYWCIRRGAAWGQILFLARSSSKVDTPISPTTACVRGRPRIIVVLLIRNHRPFSELAHLWLRPQNPGTCQIPPSRGS